MATDRYNFIYTELVTDDVDFLGMISYALYKRQKTPACSANHYHRSRSASVRAFSTGFNR